MMSLSLHAIFMPDNIPLTAAQLNAIAKVKAASAAHSVAIKAVVDELKADGYVADGPCIANGFESLCDTTMWVVRGLTVAKLT